MPHIRNRRTLIFSAVAGLAVWLTAVVGVTIRRYPGFWQRPELQFEHAQQLAAHGRNADALAAIDAALTRIPDNPHYLTFRGYRELDAKEAGAAERTFRRVLSVSAGDADARLGLAEALRREGKRTLAARVLDQMSVDSDRARLRVRSQLYGALGMPASALQDLSLLLNARPDDP
jgi:predicted Zn-dependent protease